MNTGAVLFLACLLLPTALAQQSGDARRGGVIHGTIIRQDGSTAGHIGLTASPLDVHVLGGVLPHTESNDRGEYRFEKLSWWGRYLICADDEKAGYSQATTCLAQHPRSEVTVSPEFPLAVSTVYLPAPASFIRLRVTNRNTGKVIFRVLAAVMPAEHPNTPLFTTSRESTYDLLVPPDKNWFVHVISDGFCEWDGAARPVYVRSGNTVTLDVQLEPSAFSHPRDSEKWW